MIDRLLDDREFDRIIAARERAIKALRPGDLGHGLPLTPAECRRRRQPLELELAEAGKRLRAAGLDPR